MWSANDINARLNRAANAAVETMGTNGPPVRRNTNQSAEKTELATASDDIALGRP
jgi:hypothetical protein